ncbi:Phenylacetic acid catabolic protein, partial [Roseateles sp. GG27B]
DGTPDSAARVRAALSTIWPYCNELFEADAVDAAAVALGLGPAWSELKPEWQAQMSEVLTDAGLAVPKTSGYVSSGRVGIHSEHMGHLLAELQYLQRAFPGGSGELQRRLRPQQRTDGQHLRPVGRRLGSAAADPRPGSACHLALRAGHRARSA